MCWVRHKTLLIQLISYLLQLPVQFISPFTLHLSPPFCSLLYFLMWNKQHRFECIVFMHFARLLHGCPSLSLESSNVQSASAGRRPCLWHYFLIYDFVGFHLLDWLSFQLRDFVGFRRLLCFGFWRMMNFFYVFHDMWTWIPATSFFGFEFRI